LAQPKEVLLAPLYEVHHERYAVYWKLVTPAAWEHISNVATATEQKWKMLQESATDLVKPGDATSEGAHRIRIDKSDSGVVAGRCWRQAQIGGYFSYELQTKDAKALSLVCAYGSRDKARTFEVFVNETKIATPELDGTAPGEIVIQRYDVPPAAHAGKSTVTVKFQAGPKWDGATANVFGCALVPDATTATALASGQAPARAIATNQR
jgi:hypothetical protein